MKVCSTGLDLESRLAPPVLALSTTHSVSPAGFASRAMGARHAGHDRRHIAMVVTIKRAMLARLNKG
jgi:hypothetical protein